MQSAKNLRHRRSPVRYIACMVISAVARRCYHFDVYRIGSDEEMDEIGYYEAIDGDGVCLIEWAELIYDILPPQYKKVTIKKDVEKGFDYRTVLIEEITR